MRNNLYHYIFITFISLIFFILQTTIHPEPAFANDIVLNSAISVTIPDKQSGNPGDFLTYILKFENRSTTPLRMKVDFSNPQQWEIICDPAITIPAKTDNYPFPVTVLIPATARSNTEEYLSIRLTPINESFALPTVNIPVQINAVSAINFSSPPTLAGINGSTVTYTVTVTNNGNTVEQISSTASSEHSWPVTIEPASLRLNPGDSLPVLIKHQIPIFSEFNSDQLHITFSWNSQQKMLSLLTRVTDQFEQLANSFYIWQGQFNLSHPNLTQMSSSYPDNYFSLKGQWESQGTAQLYASDLFDPNNRLWFTDINYHSWDLKTGDFSLPWSGLISPELSSGKMVLTKQNHDNYLSLYTWDSPEANPNTTPFGLETGLSKLGNLRFLHNPLPDSDQNVMEWDYSLALPSGVQWTHQVATNLSDHNGYGYLFQMDKTYNQWYLNSGYDYIHNFMEFDYRKRGWITLGQQPLFDRFYSLFQLNMETRHDTDLHRDYRFHSVFQWPSKLRLEATQDFSFLNHQFSDNSFSLFLDSPIWQQNVWKHYWLFNYSLDNALAEHSFYSTFNWSTEYAVDNHQTLILNPELVFQSQSEPTDFSKLGLGWKRRWDYGPELATFLYYDMSPKPRWQLDLGLSWRIYQYELIFKYLGYLQSGAVTTDTCSLTLQQHFSFPVKKPLGTIEGQAFLDRNHNGILDPGELPLPKINLLLDGKTSFQSDDQGKFSANTVEPGEHFITLDSKLNVIYLPEAPETKFTIKPYQDLRINVPLIRSQNLTGQIYLDKNHNSTKDPDETGLQGIPIILKNPAGQEIQRVYTNNEGFFTFYQLTPDKYQITINPEDLSEDLALPYGFTPLTILADQLDDLPPVIIGLIPYEKPIQMVNPDSDSLMITLDHELIYCGDTVKITIESSTNLKNLTLTLPSNEKIVLKTDPSGGNTWTYNWKTSTSTPTGQLSIIANATDTTGSSLKGEASLLILLK